MVGDRGPVARVVEQVVVPARPRPAAARQHARVGVEDRLVGLVGDRAEDLVLAVGGVGQQRQRLVGVGREHDLVEPLGLAPARRDQHVVGVPARPTATGVRSRRRSANGRGQRLDVASRAAADRPPARPARNDSIPWLSKNSTRKRAGKRPPLARGRPTTPPTTWGTISRSHERGARTRGARASRRARCRCRGARAARAPARLKRARSATIR